jgi:hypothetical protein
VKPSAVPQPRPVDEFLEFLKEMPLEDAIRYLRALPLRAKGEEATAYSEFRVNGGYPTYERAPGNLWDDAKRDHKKLADDKKAAEKKLKKALADNNGWFGQKKDTPEILEMKEGIAALDRELEQKAATIQEYAERWKVEEPYYQQRAEQKNAKRAQARKFEPFIEAGKQYVDQILQQKRKERKPQEKGRSLSPKGVEL